MTFTPSDLELSAEAATRLDDYLRQVRAALAGAADVNPDEIEADIREHVENELRAAPRPIAPPALEAVLAKLGPPSQWGATDDPSLLRRAGHVLRERLRDARAGAAERAKRVRFVLWNGPNDWRLAYLSFGIFALGVLTFFALFPVTLVVSYILSRAGIAHAKEQGIVLGAGRKWLLYPPVAIVSLALLIPTLMWPLVVGAVTCGEVASATYRVRDYDQPLPPPVTAQERRTWQALQSQKERMARQVEEDRKLLALVPVAREWAPLVAGFFVGFGALALWWTLLGAATASFPRATRAVFYPLCNRYEPRHGKWIAIACFVVLLPWCAAVYEIVAALV